MAAFTVQQLLLAFSFVRTGASVPVAQAEDLIGHNNPRRLQDRVDIQRLIEANWDKLDMHRLRTYFALFGREADLDTAIRLVPKHR